MLVLSPLGYPLAKTLDYIFGEEHLEGYQRAEIKAIVGMHANSDFERSPRHSNTAGGRDDGGGAAKRAKVRTPALPQFSIEQGCF